MTKRTKRAIFYIALVIFLFVSYVVVLYAQGYKFNFDDYGFYRTGSVHVKANIGADVYVDGEKAGSTSYLGNSHTVSGLLPGEYLVRLQRKDDYSSWEKKVRVEEGFVNEFSKIVLFPISGEEKEALVLELEAMLYPPALFASPSVSPTKTPKLKPTPKPTASPIPPPNIEPFYLKSDILYKNNGPETNPDELAVNVEGFSLSQDGKKLSYWSGSELWVIWLEKSNYQPARGVGDKERIIRLSRPIIKTIWYQNEDWLVVDDGKVYKVIEIDTRGGVNTIEFIK